MKLNQDGEIFKINGPVIHNEPMWKHTSFCTGGLADILARPYTTADLRILLNVSKQHGHFPFILGGGSNILVSDQGLEGLAIDMHYFNTLEIQDGKIAIAGAGNNASEVAWKLGTLGYRALDFLFGMPGSIGGAVWMNARCYGREIAEHLHWIEFMDSNGRTERIKITEGDWAYKTSPFQSLNTAIIRIALKLQATDSTVLREDMLKHLKDRQAKGHYRYPCAGSAFRNNRSFGAPSGAIIDACGLKNTRRGGASVSSWHGNILINDQAARSVDIRNLMDFVQTEVKKKRGYSMEPEIIMVGRWENRKEHIPIPSRLQEGLQ